MAFFEPLQGSKEFDIRQPGVLRRAKLLNAFGVLRLQCPNVEPGIRSLPLPVLQLLFRRGAVKQ
jgi:hypothetical protein